MSARRLSIEPVVELAVALVQRLITLQHNVIEVVAGGLVEQLGGACRAATELAASAGMNEREWVSTTRSSCGTARLAAPAADYPDDDDPDRRSGS